MRTLIISAFLISLTFATAAMADAVIGEPAPDFKLKSAEGETVTLESLKGDYVILEWTNKDCPFVRKHYDSSNMQKLQKQTAEAHDDVTWLTILSSAEGKQGHLTPAEALAHAEEVDAAASHILLDAKGVVGKAYGAKTTPHMYVIDKEGILRYAGAIDSIASADPADIETADNYVIGALGALKSGAAVEPSQTQPYGCSVKY